MPLFPGPSLPIPNFWTVFGHSYFMYAFGTRTPAGRPDSIFRNLMNIDHTSWRNYAVAGARLITAPGMSQGGYPRVMHAVQGCPPGTTTRGAPYVSQGGAYILAWGINDVGFSGNTAQFTNAYQQALTACISRCRCSTYWPCNYSGAAGTGVITYSGFGPTTGWGEQASQDTVYFNGTVGSTITITLAADYAGEAIALGFVDSAGVAGGTLTFSGTAGVTGTQVISNTQPAASGSKSYVIKRITGLTAANAGQTIIATISQIDAGGLIVFDGYWVEGINPPPVLVLNSARLNTLGYSIYTGAFTATALSGTAVTSTPGTVTMSATLGIPTAGSATIPSAGGTVTLSWTGTTLTSLTGVTHVGGSGNYSSNAISFAGPTDADVAAYNAVVNTAIALFDPMVQLVDIDSAISKTAAWLGTDGLHPNEIGAAKMADALTLALKRCTPATASAALGPAINLEQASPRTCATVVPMSNGFWYTTDALGGTNGTAYTPVAGDWWAMPFMVTTAWLRWTQWAVELLGTVTTGPQVRMCLYDDRNYSGYPQQIFNPPANATALTLASGVGVKLSTTTPGANGYVSLPMDPGLYWLGIGISVVGTGAQTMRALKGGSSYVRNLGASAANITGAPCAYKLTGQGTGVMPNSFPSGGVPSDNAPMIAILMQ